MGERPSPKSSPGPSPTSSQTPFASQLLSPLQAQASRLKKISDPLHLFRTRAATLPANSTTDTNTNPTTDFSTYSTTHSDSIHKEPATTSNPSTPAQTSNEDATTSSDELPSCGPDPFAYLFSGDDKGRKDGGGGGGGRKLTNPFSPPLDPSALDLYINTGETTRRESAGEIQEREMSDNWDAAKVPPSRFQKDPGSIFATQGSRDGHVDRNVHVQNRYVEKLKEKGWEQAQGKRRGSRE